MRFSLQPICFSAVSVHRSLCRQGQGAFTLEQSRRPVPVRNGRGGLGEAEQASGGEVLSGAPHAEAGGGACPGPAAKPIPGQDNHQRLSSGLGSSREAVSSGQELRFPTPGAWSCHAGINRYHGQHVGTDHVTANHQNLQRSRAFVSQRTKCIGPLSCSTWETRKMKQTCLNCVQQQEKGGSKSGICSSGVSLGLQPVPGHAERQGTHACLSTLGSPTAFCISSFLD